MHKTVNLADTITREKRTILSIFFVKKRIIDSFINAFLKP